MKHFTITPLNWKKRKGDNSPITADTLSGGMFTILFNGQETYRLMHNHVSGTLITGTEQECLDKANKIHMEAISNFLTPETEDRQKEIFKAGYFAGNAKVRAAGDSMLMDKIITDDFNKIKDTL